MPVTTTWRPGNRKGYQVRVVTNPTGPLTGLLLAESAKGIMDLLGPGYAMVILIKLPGVGWRSPGGGFIRSGADIKNIVLDENEYEGVDYEDGSPGESPLIDIDEAVYMVRKLP